MVWVGLSQRWIHVVKWGFRCTRAYDKAAIGSNGREAITNFELSSYQIEINSETNNQGGHDKLDLSLGMSLSPGNASKKNGRLFHYP
ncbi:hypothetical protein Bca101_026990 [Brassica carinata]